MPAMIYILALICAALLAGVAVLSSRWQGRSDGPSTLLCVTWACVLGIYGASGEYFYPIELQTLLCFTAAPLAFLTGETLALRLLPSSLPQRQPELPAGTLGMVLFWSVLLLACLPAYYDNFVGDSDLNPEINLIAAIRNLSLDDDAAPAQEGFSIVKNLQPFSFILPFFAVLALKGRHWALRALLIVSTVALSMAYGLLTGSKGVVPSLALCLCVLMIYRNGGKVRGSWVLPLLCFGAMGFLVLIRYVNYTFDEGAREADLWFNAVKAVVGYLGSPVVALDTYLRHPELIDVSGQALSRPLVYMINAVNAQLGLPPEARLPALHLPYVPVGPTIPGDAFNTFSYLSPYLYSAGIPGFLIAPLLLGAALALIHRRAAHGSLFFLILFLYLARALLLSFNGENLILDIANIIKLLVVIYLMATASTAAVRRLQPSWHGKRSATPAAPSPAP